MSKGCLIEVTEFRAIGSDANSWLLLRRNKAVDKETKKPIGGYTTWTAYKYPHSFEVAAATLEEELIRTCGATTFTELKRSAERIHAIMLETLDAGKLASL